MNNDNVIAGEFPENPRIPRSGDGGNGSMESRIAKLEAHVGHIQSDVSELKLDIKTVNGNMTDVFVRLTRIESAMASKGFVVVALMTLLAAIAALIGYADQLQAFLNR